MYIILKLKKININNNKNIMDNFINYILDKKLKNNDKYLIKYIIDFIKCKYCDKFCKNEKQHKTVIIDDDIDDNYYIIFDFCKGQIINIYNNDIYYNENTKIYSIKNKNDQIDTYKEYTVIRNMSRVKNNKFTNFYKLEYFNYGFDEEYLILFNIKDNLYKLYFIVNNDELYNTIDLNIEETIIDCKFVTDESIDVYFKIITKSYIYKMDLDSSKIIKNKRIFV
jgi:Pyruvate/2-oxoacid:ferredoxin oxidoreductase delta subunit